ncbi:EAL domain-containing protein [Herbaspirillum sp. RTI4]|uniref:two-component system response regulator n=1 Tax=Herbaspirillum sp. RTI4 TaxID=3048640 RepID=UPI002AB4FFE2|nr:EAL domain-containing protein [Herbaspirillum sp. RTI4]MDY7578681.1 EAL domain-containing protein [Herbaspirillum sp. RTI4]MEA9980621.1 EAL domain-containing protein [Herbaspirillum sp. RTI4]
MKFEKILVVEDEPVVALDLQQTLEDMGHQVCAIRSTREGAIEAVEQYHPSLVLMDIHLQGSGDGIDACAAIYQQWQLPVIFLTAYADGKTVDRAAACKPFGYLMKPYQTNELHAVMQIARSRHDVEMSLIKSEARLALAIEAAELGAWEWESKLDRIKGDTRFLGMWGNTLSPFSAGLASLFERIHPEDRPQVEAHFEIMGFFNCCFRAQRDSGDYAWLEMYGNLQNYGPGNQIVVGALRDVTQRKKTEESLRQASVVFATISEGIMILDESGKLISGNPAFFKLTGYVESELQGSSPRESLLTKRFGDPTYAEIAVMQEGVWSGEVTCRRKNGVTFSAWQQICAVRDGSGTPVHYVHLLSDLTGIQETEHQLLHLAYHDFLTKLPNRRLMLDRLKHAMSASARSGETGALLFIDLDDFKTLNDTQGHDAGDSLLEQVAARLLACVRESDTVARFGGDEFMVLLEQLSPALSDACLYTEMVGKKIVAALNRPYRLGSHEYHCSASVGATLFDGTRQKIDELIKQADISMYQSKKNGRNMLSFFDPDMQQSVNKRAGLEGELHKALENEQFQLHFQIQVNDSGRAVGAEALIRWMHPQRGVIQPNDFIPLAEETGLILPIGSWVLETACLQIQAWQQDEQTRDLVLAVNVSARQLRQPDFGDRVRMLVQCYAIAPKLLKLEITESMLLSNIEETIETMTMLKKAGIQFSLDDFGSGYSSLQYLKRLPLDQLKIDQSFVRDLASNQSDRTIIKTIITMAKNLNLEVIAEGVETEDQKNLLQGKGCNLFQGYLFGKPVAIDEFHASLRRLQVPPAI